MRRKTKIDEGPGAFVRFQNLIRGLASVPKKEVEVEEAKWREAQLMKKKPSKT
jgi:hypothetical protein